MKLEEWQKELGDVITEQNVEKVDFFAKCAIRLDELELKIFLRLLELDNNGPGRHHNMDDILKYVAVNENITQQSIDKCYIASKKAFDDLVEKAKTYL